MNKMICQKIFIEKKNWNIFQIRIETSFMNILIKKLAERPWICIRFETKLHGFSIEKRSLNSVEIFFCTGFNIFQRNYEKKFKRWFTKFYFKIRFIQYLFKHNVRYLRLFGIGYVSTVSKLASRDTVCFANLDQISKMIIFGSISTTFIAIFIFWGSWGSSK